MSETSLAELAWNRYRVTVGNLSFENQPLPAWEDLGERQKAGWRAAAEIVAEHVAAQIAEEA